MEYDIVIVGAGAVGVFASYEFTKLNTNAKILLIDKGLDIEDRLSHYDKNNKKNSRIDIMHGFGGAGALSDGKYNITTNFGGDLHKTIGKEEALTLMEYVDEVLCNFDEKKDLKLFSTGDCDLKTIALRHNLHLLDAKVRHFGTDRNIEILKKIRKYIDKKIDTKFSCTVEDITVLDDKFILQTSTNEQIVAKDVILAGGRSGSKWISKLCTKLDIPFFSNKVDIGVRVELPAEIFKHITDEVYESKLVYQTKQYNDLVRTFCMNPYGQVVMEKSDDLITVNGHSFTDKKLHSENTNFALLVSNTFTEPFKNSNEYGESIARLSNMLGGNVLVQRFGDLVKGRRSSERRMQKCFTRPTLNATAGDLSLVLPKRQLDNIIEMIFALDKIAPGTANEDTLLYGVEVKFYNSKVEVDENLETKIKGLFAAGDGSGITHSLSQASACGVKVARILNEKYNR